MGAMSATTTSRGAKPHMAPSFHVGGGFVYDDDGFGDFVLSSIVLIVADMTLEAFAYTWS
jgi:hypothetical protein